MSDIRGLALDIAGTTGWAFGSPGVVPRHGVVKSSSHLDGTHSYGPEFVRFEKQIGEMISVFRPTHFAFEAPVPAPHQNNAITARRLIGLVSVAELVATRAGVPHIHEIHSGTAKAHFAGHGHAKKPQIVQACLKRGWIPTDDNDADALALLDLLASRYRFDLADGPSVFRSSL